jgi:uncharacterized membrane protein
MGFTKEQGIRLYMYEAFFVISAASICGTAIGLITSVLVTAQFYLFLELPLEFHPPYVLMALCLVVSFSTTFFAVLIPIKEVNNRRIAVVLKSSS